MYTRRDKREIGNNEGLTCGVKGQVIVCNGEGFDGLTFALGELTIIEVKAV